ncbi:hypothetical protein MAR_022686 [Mya arenaria]|uniref:Uncharacterized protein n=1 Tax=Mya arenaria TaxID=6604 RepID=A0ABY7DMC4_MYAAR|nr:hypothetical protein MAR_022686 [Mya arenaria]
MRKTRRILRLLRLPGWLERQ